MNRHFSIILAGLFYTSTICGQIQNDVKNTLSKKDFVSFSVFADTLSKIDIKANGRWTILRDLTPDFKEGVFYITINSVDKYRIRLLTMAKTIIYYDLSEKRYEKVKKEWIPHYYSLDNFKNDSLFTILRQSFFRSFDGDLNESELFIDDLVYGQACGIVGSDPQEMIMINNLVVAKNKEELLKWIKSSTFEKQIYALDGLFQLKASGTEYSPQELKVIKNVANKRGTIFHCRGCVHGWTDARIVTYKFKFD